MLVGVTARTMFHRTSLNCRLKTRVSIIGFSVLLICCLLLYRALTSMHAAYPRKYHSLPTMQQRNSPRQRLQQQNIPNDPFQANMLRSNKINDHLKYAHLISKEFERKADREPLSDDSRGVLLKLLSSLFPMNWATAAETDEVALDLKYTLIDHGLESKMSCKQIDQLALDGSVTYSASSFLEYAYQQDRSRAALGNSISSKTHPDQLAYVVKSLSSDRDIKVACMKQVYQADRCAAMGNYRLLREVLLLSVLRHPNVITIEGYCLRGSRVSMRLSEKGLIIVTEMGIPVTPSAISGMSWSQRIKMALQIGQLLLYLENSPMGSLRLKKLSLKDFLLVRGQHLKLAELAELELADLPCRDSSECGQAEATAAPACNDGLCQGRNHIINFHIMAKDVLQQLLHNPPGGDEEVFVTNLRLNQLDLVQFVGKLQLFSNKSEATVTTPAIITHPALVVAPDKTQGGVHVEAQDRVWDEHIQDAGKAVSTLEEVLSNFMRYDHKNFAGIYDYLCAGSRVTWGCVHIVTSLMEAATLCLKDHICRCFVTFSSQPESDNLMTVVLKNDTDPSPHVSSGTTLFVRRSAVPNQSVVERGPDAETKKLEEKRAASAPPASVDLENCIDDTMQDQEPARYVREKRLMTHLGLKGVRELAWRRSALRHHITGLSHLKKTQEGGGQFVANLTNKSVDDGDLESRKVVFIAEDGPSVYHMAYAVVYHLDRLLGLYHTPPCVGKQLAAADVDHYLSNDQWDTAFRSLVEADGTLSGILAVPTPKVMKVIQLSMESLTSMTRKIVPFSRSEKLQLEYILLWWLGQIGYAVGDHQGYKDHLIHFYADKAFANKDLDMSGYLYHCQFPNVVYKSLACFQCAPRQEIVDNPPAVCSLGQEAVQRARAMFVDDVEMFIHNLGVPELVELINSAATSTLHIIHSCIQTFGSESVLY